MLLVTLAMMMACSSRLAPFGESLLIVVLLLMLLNEQVDNEVVIGALHHLIQVLIARRGHHAVYLTLALCTAEARQIRRAV